MHYKDMSAAPTAPAVVLYIYIDGVFFRVHDDGSHTVRCWSESSRCRVTYSDSRVWSARLLQVFFARSAALFFCNIGDRSMQSTIDRHPLQISVDGNITDRQRTHGDQKTRSAMWPVFAVLLSRVRQCTTRMPHTIVFFFCSAAKQHVSLAA